MKNWVLIASVFCFSPSALCQSDLGPPATVVAGLRSDDPKVKATLARLLRLKQFEPQRDLGACDIRADATKLDEHGGTSVLQVKCDNEVNVVVLREHGPISEVIDSQYFRSANGRPSVGFVSLITPTEHEIVIHNVTSSSDNRYFAPFLVLRLIGNKLLVVFSSRGARENLKTTFTTIPASERQSGGISEETILNVGHYYVIHRSFVWSDDRNAFVQDGAPKLGRADDLYSAAFNF